MTVIARKSADESYVIEKGVRPLLSPLQKAAVIVRLMAAEGIEMSLAGFSDELQTLVAGQIAQMQAIDRETLKEVVEEFCTEIEAVGMTFPDGLDGTIEMLDGRLSVSASSRLRRLVNATSRGDPWARIADMSVDVLTPVLIDESPEVGAVVLSKLAVPQAAELLGKVPLPKARHIAYAVSLTGNIAPDVVQRIGAVLLQQLDSAPNNAFSNGPVERVGAILNQSTSVVRENVLEGLEEEDSGFADEVKKAIFTFALIPARIAPADLTRILREVDQSLIVTALAAATEGPDAVARDFILNNISQRLSGTLREEMQQRGKVKGKDAEDAQSGIVNAIREMEAAGEISFASSEEPE